MVAAGAVLILSALLLFLFNSYEDRQAGQEAQILLQEVQAAIPAQTVPPVSEPPRQTQSAETLPEETLSESFPLPTEPLPPELPEVEIQGYGYVGWLSIPDIELELPVLSQWDYVRLKKGPCRHAGSSRTDDLVIAAHNYKSLFRNLHQLQPGAEIFFTDMEGIENRYVLVKLETLSPKAVDEVLNSEYDLVLYTCTPGGATRVTAFCQRAE